MSDSQSGCLLQLSPWAGLREQQTVCRHRGDIEQLFEEIDKDIARLARRVDSLDARLNATGKVNHNYLRSKHFTPPDTTVTAVERLSPRLPSKRSVRHFELRRDAWARNNVWDVAGHLLHSREILVVGEVRKGKTLDRAIGIHPGARRLDPGEGFTRPRHYPIPDRYRPGLTSLAHWLAFASETERQAVDVIVLGDDAGRQDVELLSRRLDPRTLVLTEPGSVATAWLATMWDGGIHSVHDVLVWGEPGMRFREPSRLALPAAGGWPKISVITVSYNQVDYLEYCLRSILDQGYPNLEYIVVDACSTDGSDIILRQYQDRISHLVIEPDGGQSEGLCKGFDRATGDILTWVNSDDALAPNSLRRAALAFLDYDADMVAGTCERIGGEEGALLGRHYAALPTCRVVDYPIEGPIRWADSWELGDYFFQPEVFFKRGIWEAAGGGLKRHLHWAMDWDLWLRFAAAGARVVRIPDILGVSRVHAEQKTSAEELYLPQIVGILQEYKHVYKLIAEKLDAEQYMHSHECEAASSKARP